MVKKASDSSNGIKPLGPADMRRLAHDLNNLFGAIGGFAKFIVEDAPPGGDMQAYGQKIIAAADQGSALAKRLALGANG